MLKEEHSFQRKVAGTIKCMKGPRHCGQSVRVARAFAVVTQVLNPYGTGDGIGTVRVKQTSIFYLFRHA